MNEIITIFRAKAEDEDDQGVQESGTQIYKNEFPTFAPDHISEGNFYSTLNKENNDN